MDPWRAANGLDRATGNKWHLIAGRQEGLCNVTCALLRRPLVRCLQLAGALKEFTTSLAGRRRAPKNPKKSIRNCAAPRVSGLHLRWPVSGVCKQPLASCKSQANFPNPWNTEESHDNSVVARLAMEAVAARRPDCSSTQDDDGAGRAHEARTKSLGSQLDEAALAAQGEAEQRPQQAVAVQQLTKQRCPTSYKRRMAAEADKQTLPR